VGWLGGERKKGRRHQSGGRGPATREKKKKTRLVIQGRHRNPRLPRVKKEGKGTGGGEHKGTGLWLGKSKYVDVDKVLRQFIGTITSVAGMTSETRRDSSERRQV